MKDKIKELIGENQIEAAFKVLENILIPNSEEANVFLLLKNRFRKVQKQNIIGVLSSEEFIREEIKISNDFIEFIENINTINLVDEISEDLTDAFEFIENHKHCFRFYYKSTDKSTNDKIEMTFKVDSLRLTQGGDFEILESYEYESIGYITTYEETFWGAFKKKKRIYNVKTKTKFTGNFIDISKVEYLEEDIDAGIIFHCYNGREKVWAKTEPATDDNVEGRQ